MTNRKAVPIMAETNWGADFLNDCFGPNKTKEPTGNGVRVHFIQIGGTMSTLINTVVEEMYQAMKDSPKYVGMSPEQIKEDIRRSMDATWTSQSKPEIFGDDDD